MKTAMVDGLNVTMFMERGSGDGGIVLNYLVAEADGTFSNYRHWFSDPTVATQEYEAVKLEDLRPRIILARKIVAGEPIEAKDVPPPAVTTGQVE